MAAVHGSGAGSSHMVALVGVGAVMVSGVATCAPIEAWQAEVWAVDIAHGVPEARARWNAADEKLNALFVAMFATPATTVAGIVARLADFRDSNFGESPEMEAIIADVHRLLPGGTS